MGLLPDFVLDYISVNTFWSILFIVHALLAVALLGALTHQAVAVLMPVRQAAGAGDAVLSPGFAACTAPGYAVAVCVLWIVTFFSARGFTRSIACTSVSRSSRRDIGRRRASSR